jgi:hypothetical protein
MLHLYFLYSNIVLLSTQLQDGARIVPLLDNFYDKDHRAHLMVDNGEVSHTLFVMPNVPKKYKFFLNNVTINLRRFHLIYPVIDCNLVIL